MTSGPSWDDYPCWPPDRSHIAFASDRSGNWDIWVIPAGGGTPTQVTFDPASDWFAAWSPDGEKIAFGSDRSGSFDIWVIDVEVPVSVEQTSWGSIKTVYR